jgi:peroxiredoxin
MKRNVIDHPLREKKYPSVLISIGKHTYLAIVHQGVVSLDLNHDGVIQEKERVQLDKKDKMYEGRLSLSYTYNEQRYQAEVVFLSTDPQKNLGFFRDMMRKGSLWDGTVFFLHSYEGRFDHPRAEIIIDANGDGVGDTADYSLRIRVSDCALSWKGERWACTVSSSGDSIQWTQTINSSLRVGEMAPTFSAVDIKGVEHTNKEYMSDWVLLDFWATWCASCVQDHKNLKRIQKKHRLKILGFAQNTRKEIKRYLRKKKLSWPQISIEEDRSILDSFSIDVLPTYVLIDTRGRLFYMGSLSGIEEQLLLQKR